jgi:hypothetical protein
MRNLAGAAMVADIRDVAIALFVNRWLISAARLQIIVADEAHVHGFGRITNLRRLSASVGGKREDGEHRCH